MGVGFCFDEVPVVDVIILRKYFSEATYHIDKAQKAANGSYKIKTIKSYALYRTEDEAYQVIENYLKEPPHIKIHKDCVKPKFFPQPLINKADKPVVTTLWDVVPPSFSSLRTRAAVATNTTKLNWRVFSERFILKLQQLFKK